MKLALIVAGALVALPADQKQDTREVSLAMTAYTSDPDRVGAGSAGVAELQIEEAWLSYRNVQLRGAAACKTAVAAQIPGPVTADLISGRAIGLPERIELAATPYCGVALTLRRSRTKADDVPAGLRGHSILIRGRLADGTRVVLRSRTDQRVWLASRGEGGFSAADGERWILAADLARWMSGIDLATAEVSRDGETPTIRIDERHNRELLTTFEESLPHGLGLFRDADRDGGLQDAERTGDDWLASGD